MRTGDSAGSIRRFYDHWPQYNARLVDVIRPMTPDDLATRPSPDRWPIWATVGHTAGGRVYWLCTVLGEAGAERTPFGAGFDGYGWEDDLDHPRAAAELVDALETSFAIVEHCLDTWHAGTLAEEVEVAGGETRRRYSRGSILQRLLTHDAYHCGELSQTLGIAGLPQIDLWTSG
ncbi:MAG TPA: DinB family protein [Candidatus Limnocylindrales bacterium]|nr:DinB family protein [Candidatus Limnocylindrales bacterium]